MKYFIRNTAGGPVDFHGVREPNVPYEVEDWIYNAARGHPQTFYTWTVDDGAPKGPVKVDAVTSTPAPNLEASVKNAEVPATEPKPTGRRWTRKKN